MTLVVAPGGIGTLIVASIEEALLHLDCEHARFLSIRGVGACHAAADAAEEMYFCATVYHAEQESY